MPVLLLVLMLAVAGAVDLPARRQARRAHGARHAAAGTSTPAPGEQIVSVKRTSASDYDPLGDDEEHSEEALLAVDQDPGTAWTTESYQDDTLNKPTGEPGVGLYIDAEPSVNGRALEIQTPSPGWKMELYGAAERRRRTSGQRRLDEARRRHRREAQAALRARHGRQAYRYYLVWITKLPPGEDSVAINQVTLSAPKSDR